jgi:hypothetical protein
MLQLLSDLDQPIPSKVIIILHFLEVAVTPSLPRESQENSSYWCQ